QDRRNRGGTLVIQSCNLQIRTSILHDRTHGLVQVKEPAPLGAGPNLWQPIILAETIYKANLELCIVGESPTQNEKEVLGEPPNFAFDHERLIYALLWLGWRWIWRVH